MIVAETTEPFRILTYNSFVALDANVDDYKQKFDAAVTISSAELKTQIHFDLCLYYLYIKKYDLARQNIILCRDNLHLLKDEYNRNNVKEFAYCNINEDDMNGYLLACGVIFEEKFNLLQRMNESALNKYKVFSFLNLFIKYKTSIIRIHTLSGYYRDFEGRQRKTRNSSCSKKDFGIRYRRLSSHLQS